LWLYLKGIQKEGKLRLPAFVVTYENKTVLRFIAIMSNEGNLPSFLRVAERQKHSISDREGEKFKLEASSPSTLVYVQNCKNCECEFERKAMKVIVEGCQDCVFNINSTLITGMFEVLNCENIVLNLQENGVVRIHNVHHACVAKCNILEFLDNLYSDLINFWILNLSNKRLKTELYTL
jgi:hypothetical protein